MPGAYVFPGGAVDAVDGSPEHLAHAAALTSLPPLHPRVRLDENGRIAGVLLPGHAGYDTALGAG